MYARRASACVLPRSSSSQLSLAYRTVHTMCTCRLYMYQHGHTCTYVNLQLSRLHVHVCSRSTCPGLNPSSFTMHQDLSPTSRDSSSSPERSLSKSSQERHDGSSPPWCTYRLENKDKRRGHVLAKLTIYPHLCPNSRAFSRDRRQDARKQQPLEKTFVRRFLQRQK